MKSFLKSLKPIELSEREKKFLSVLLGNNKKIKADAKSTEFKVEVDPQGYISRPEE